jgi:recombination protein RecR
VLNIETNAAPLARLIDCFESLPSIGRKTAQRLAFHIMNIPREKAQNFADAILDAHDKVRRCSVCQNLSEGEICQICASRRRNERLICVVEDPRDVMAVERTHDFNGLYHVLHGCISPMDGIGPDALTIKELITRAASGVDEIIMATNPTVEGEATAIYLSKLIKPFGVRVTRLAYGIPVGGGLEFADEVTLSRALEGRSEL